MKFNHEELEKYSKELFESINDNSIQLDSSHFILFNINSFILFNKNYDANNDRTMDIMLYLLDRHDFQHSAGCRRQTAGL